MKKFTLVLSVLLCFIKSSDLIAQTKKHTLSGYVREASSKELLPGVTIYVPELEIGTSTNTYGFYSLTLPEGEYEIIYSFVGYEAEQFNIQLNQDTEKDIVITPSSQQLKEVEIVAERQQKVSEVAQMSKISLPTRQVKDIPAIMGEKDVMKVMQLMPGVQSGSEGTSGIYVRGGGPDQNLIILDDATVYNSSHLFGIFSVFNGDALKSVELYKGGFPARFGGRLSSVMKMDMKEGHKQEFHGNGSVGLIASSLVLEGPIIKDKASFLISGRRTYLDLLARPFLPETFKVGYFFHDLNAKVNYDISKKDKIYLSGFFGRDKFFSRSKQYEHNSYLDKGDLQLQSEAGLQWGNQTATLRWNHLFSNKLFSNTSLIYSQYNFTTMMEDESFIEDSESYSRLNYSSGIRDFTLKFDIDYLPNPAHHIRAGLMTTNHRFTPSAISMQQKAPSIALDTSKQMSYYTLESALYVEDNWKPTKRLNIEAGLRLSHFAHNSTHYINPEPRFSAAYKIGPDLSAKASFASMNQYIHLLTNSGSSMPTDLWVSSTDRVRPQRSWQIAAGLAKDFEAADLSLTLEGYYKKSTDVINYKEGASFMMLQDFSGAQQVNWEDQVTSGEAESYGMELLLQRKYGKLSGWLGYTLSWTQMQFDELNFGRPFWAKYDRRHDISLVGIYKISDRITLSGTWVYGTGNALTMPFGKFNMQQYNLNPTKNYERNRTLNAYSERSNFRAEAYHRLDLSIQFHKKKRWGKRTWELGLYNAYNRKNPFYYTTRNEEVGGNKSIRRLAKVTILPVIPSFSYRFEF